MYRISLGVSYECRDPISLCQDLHKNEPESRILVTRLTWIPFSRRLSHVSHPHPRCRWMVSGRNNTHNFQIRIWFPSIEFDCSGILPVICLCATPVPTDPPGYLSCLRERERVLFLSFIVRKSPRLHHHSRRCDLAISLSD